MKTTLRCRLGFHKRTKDEHEADVRKGYAKFVCHLCGQGVWYGLTEAHDDLMIREALEKCKQERLAWKKQL